MRIIQLLPKKAPFGMAEEAHSLRRLFAAWGWESEIGSECGSDLPAGDLLVLHFSRFSPVEELPRPGAEIVVVLHEAVPAHRRELYERGDLDRQLLADEHLRRLAGCCRLAVGHCERACDILESFGFARVRRLPPYIDGLWLEGPPDPYTREYLKGPSPIVMYAGDTDPGSGMRDLVKAVWFFRSFLGGPLRLLAVGDIDACPQYCFEMTLDQRTLFIEPEGFLFARAESQPQLRSFFAAADIYVHLDVDDLDGAMLVHAMQRGIPCVALAAGAAPDVLDGAGVLLEEPIHSTIAEEFQRLLTDDGLRRHVVHRQNERLRELAPERVAFLLRSILSRYEKERK